jgi:uncharacterized coiled-coil DUF342 family protein
MKRTKLAQVSGLSYDKLQLIAHDALKMAVEHVLGKIKEGKKLSTEDVLVLYLSTIVNELKDVRSGVARLEEQDR